MAHTTNDEHLDTESERMHHITPPSIYLGVFLALIVFTAVTVWVAYIDLGWLSTPIALLIAGIKASLVVLYFMHVRWSNHVVWIVVAGSIFWLGILFVLTWSDYFSRGLVLT
jgi:cytochrome c oxidase subunit 4